MKVLVLLFLVGAIRAETTCEDCAILAGKLTAIVNSEDNLNGQVGLFIGEVCSVAPDPADCYTRLPEFWFMIAKYLWDQDEGWFAVKNFCGDVCAADNALSGVMPCYECENRINVSLDQFGDEETIASSAVGFQEICNSVENPEECRAAMEIVIPAAFLAIYHNTRVWIPGFCQMEISCSA